MNSWLDWSMGLVDLGCPLVRSYPLERAMNVLEYVGHGAVAGGIALGILVYGIATRDRRTRRIGLATLLAVLVAGLLGNFVKLVFETPRPTRSWSYGFPSGHTGTAFAMAGALGQAFPAGAPFFYLFAVLAGVARLYDRSHFVIDVIGGGLLGTASGILITRQLVGFSGMAWTRARRQWQWGIPIAIGVLALGFFTAYERAVAAYRPSGASSPGNAPSSVVVNFGAPAARSLLRGGWSADERWEGSMPIVWAEGLESTLALPPLPQLDHRIRLKAHPYVRQGGRPPCQVTEVALNGVPVARLLLERGWNEYELKVPKNLIAPGTNELRFRFAYAERPPAGAEALSRDERALSAAFASLEGFADDRGKR